MDAEIEKRLNALEGEVLALRQYLSDFASVTEPAIKNLAAGLKLQKQVTLDIAELIRARPEQPGGRAGLN